jgi:hypothetical protein
VLPGVGNVYSFQVPKSGRGKKKKMKKKKKTRKKNRVALQFGAY